MLLIWAGLALFLVFGVAAAMPTTFPTVEARQVFAQGIASNPTELLTVGPVFDSSIGGLTAWRVRGWMALLFALVSLFIIIRQTRSEESNGRSELIGSNVVGKYAQLTAALILTFSANIVIAVLMAGGLIGIGLPVAGSIALGLSAAASGWVFAAIAAVAAQLTESSGSARGIVIAFVGLFYAIRAIGDTSGEHSRLSWLSWLSPYSWIESVRPFGGENWWPFLLVLSFIVILIIMAYVMSLRRDTGAGVLPQRSGPATASILLQSPIGLAWRLNRSNLLFWTIGFAGFGALLGAIAQSLSTQLNASPQFKDIITQMGGNAGPIDGFFSLIIYLLAQVVSAYAILAVLRLRSEERRGHAEFVLNAPVSRIKWASSHIFIAIVGPAVILAALGISMGLTSGLSTGNLWYELSRLLSATMVRLPAIWVMAGIAMILYGLKPRFAGFISWTALAIFILLELVVELKLISPLVLVFSPFVYAPALPAAELTIAPLVGLTCVALILTVTGLIKFRRRDIG
jgi:ABC-2 type transport system permease protein